MWEIGLVIVIILIFVMMAKKNNWSRDPNVSYVAGINAPKGGQGDGNVERLPQDYENEAGCRKACAGLDWCNAYTWFDPATGVNSGECYGMKNVGKKTPLLGANSGVRPPDYSATLQRRLGMDGAGASSTPEQFRTNSAVGSFDERFSTNKDIARGTMWAGYQK